MSSSAPTGGSSSGSKVVIGVDDAPENLFLLQAAAKSGGFFFVGAKSGPECLSLVHRIAPRLILLDIQMPEMDGFETCRRLRANPELKRVPIAFLTAQKSPADVQTCIDVGGNDFIVKPFNPIKLIERMRHWTSRTL